jgi:hypothetical protein
MIRRYYGANPFGPEYLLLGLLDAGPPPVTTVFAELGVTGSGFAWWLSSTQGAPQNGWLVPAPLGRSTGYLPRSRWVALAVSMAVVLAFLAVLILSSF